MSHLACRVLVRPRALARSSAPLAACFSVVACAVGGASHPAGGSAPDLGGAASDGGLGSIVLTDPGDGGSDGGHLTRCDDAGNCSCIRIASIGHEGVWGPCSSDSTTALQNWLNTESTATVDNYDTAKPTLTPAFLGQYDVIILQWMVATGKQNDDGAPWGFSADEIAALRGWVESGGGLIALNGYQCNGSGCTIYDVTATNQLLSFTDIQFNSDDVLDPGKVSCQDCYCWGGSLPLGSPLPEGGAPAAGQWDQSSPIGAHLDDVGAYVARSIQSTTASVDCADATHQYAVHEQVGGGHIVAYGDEWVTYSGEWLGTAACLDPAMFTNVYDPCYQKSAAQVFQIPQFWYNAIKYAASSVQCFSIQNSGIIP
jgi:hypothetical protein